MVAEIILVWRRRAAHLLAPADELIEEVARVAPTAELPQHARVHTEYLQRALVRLAVHRPHELVLLGDHGEGGLPALLLHELRGELRDRLERRQRRDARNLPLTAALPGRCRGL